MTSKEKAEKLVFKFANSLRIHYMSHEFIEAKRCAFIAVREIKEAIDWHEFETPNKELQFWSEVESEIEKL